MSSCHKAKGRRQEARRAEAFQVGCGASTCTWSLGSTHERQSSSITSTISETYGISALVTSLSKLHSGRLQNCISKARMFLLTLESLSRRPTEDMTNCVNHTKFRYKHSFKGRIINTYEESQRCRATSRAKFDLSPM